MNNAADILVVTQEPQVAQAVANAINVNGQWAARGVCRGLDELVITLERGVVPAVVVDIDPKPTQMLSDLDQIIGRHPATRFVVVSSSQGDLLVQAMQVGVRHFLLKDRIEADLRSVLQRLIPANAGTRNGHHLQGSVVTVLSAGGGCGATTLAINLANELHLLSNQPTLLIDMDVAYGAAAGYLGINAQYGIADVLRDGDRIDSHLVRSTAVVHSDDLHVLVSPATVDMESPATLQFEHLGRMLQKARETYTYTVIDAPRVPLPVSTLLTSASALTCLVLEMNVEHIRVARSMYAALAGRGMAQDRILPLVSRYRGRREMITIEDAQRAIGCTRIGQLSNDYKAVLSSINYGKPLAVHAPKSALRLDVLNLARQVQQQGKSAKVAEAAR